jgi:hypothetical protein
MSRMKHYLVSQYRPEQTVLRNTCQNEFPVRIFYTNISSTCNNIFEQVNLPPEVMLQIDMSI